MTNPPSVTVTFGLKTVGDLRNLILQNAGKIQMGQLAFYYSHGEDIDVKIDGNLLMWWDKTTDENQSLFEKTSMQNDYASVQENLKEMKNLKETVKQSSLAEGKVAALEAIIEKAQTITFKS